MMSTQSMDQWGSLPFWSADEIAEEVREAGQHCRNPFKKPLRLIAATASIAIEATKSGEELRLDLGYIGLQVCPANAVAAWKHVVELDLRHNRLFSLPDT